MVSMRYFRAVGELRSVNSTPLGISSLKIGADPDLNSVATRPKTQVSENRVPARIRAPTNQMTILQDLLTGRQRQNSRSAAFSVVTRKQPPLALQHPFWGDLSPLLPARIAPLLRALSGARR